VDVVRIASAKLPPGTVPLRLVQISDLHLGLMYDQDKLALLVTQVEALKPDLLVATGDIIDGEARHINGYTARLRELHAPLGKYAVTGNHEFYVGLEQALDLMDHAGFKVLRNERTSPLTWLDLVGVDDPSGARMGKTTGISEQELLAAARADRFVLLLKHPPRISDSALQHVDLQLSGHIHGGQIAPFGLLTWLVYRQHTGLTRLAGGMQLYVNRGTGTWGPPIRFLAPPEITLFEIVPAADSSQP
jgi:predicted MPP superfamily phosphohydrolase